MKKILISLTFLLVYSCSSQKEEKSLIFLPLEKAEGFGPFKESFSLLNWSSNEQAEKETRGIPENWKIYYVKKISFDFIQTTYQNFNEKGFSKSQFQKKYNTFIKSPHNRNLSEKSINSYVNIVFRIKGKNIIEYIIDTNNDKDFSDESVRILKKRKSHFNYLDNIKESPSVKFQLSTNNGIINKSVKILFLENSDNDIIYSFPQYYRTTFLNRKLKISNGFYNLSFDEKSSIIIGDNPKVIEIHELFEIENITYKNLGVDINKNMLILEKLPKNKEFFSTNVGYNAIPFSVKKLNSKDSISLSDFKGKYVFSDFWGTWCAPCLMELPTNIYAYEQTSRKNIEFLGIAVHDKKQKLENIINDFEINYPQVLESDAKNLKEKYNIIGFPTTLLIDRKGKIIAKNLKGEKLLDTLNYYIKNYK